MLLFYYVFMLCYVMLLCYYVMLMLCYVIIMCYVILLCYVIMLYSNFIMLCYVIMFLTRQGWSSITRSVSLYETQACDLCARDFEPLEELSRATDDLAVNYWPRATSRRVSRERVSRGNCRTSGVYFLPCDSEITPQEFSRGEFYSSSGAYTPC